MRIDINVTNLKSELAIFLKVIIIMLVGEFILKHSFSFFEIITLFILLGIDSRINRKDFYITDIINKDECDDIL